MSDLSDGPYSSDAPVWDLIRPHTGAVTAVTPAVPKGSDSDIAAFVETTHGKFFAKGMRNQPGGRRDCIFREKAVNPYVQVVSPPLLWEVQDEEWVVLGFEFVPDARRADFCDPGDVGRVVEVLNRIHDLPLPEVAKPWVDERWDWFTRSDDEITLLRGDNLVHGDIGPGNYLLSEHGTWTVDWAWPTRGPAFLDPALLVVQLISAGYDPQRAEEHVHDCTGWNSADPAAIDVFAAANMYLMGEAAKRAPNTAWLAAMDDATRAWAAHRKLI